MVVVVVQHPPPLLLVLVPLLPLLMLPQLLLLLLLPCLLLYGYPPLLFSRALLVLILARALWAVLLPGLHQHRRARGDAPLIEELARQSAQIALNQISRPSCSCRRRSTGCQEATLLHDVHGILTRVCELFPHTHIDRGQKRPVWSAAHEGRNLPCCPLRR